MPSDTCNVVIDTLTHDPNPICSYIPRSRIKPSPFMQRAAQKDDKPKEVEKVTPGADFGASPSRRCIVIMDGDPHPAALKGRMSFQSFNPSIDKLNEEAANNQQNRSGTSNNSGISKRRASHKQQKREKLDWNLLRPPKSGNRG
ncbi:hypothetical protein C4D60_Mb10t16280 [Musa balbisiana]|uniref:Uncharacterized protein n=1 Tax=Musa balbisiana TaxID=52838 RepID=A0A4S8IXL7_MUSBA|nr:hypothetical protein C4D60_Mb10t16280 [Musa balbisiana]